MTLTKKSPLFYKICDYCNREIVQENLSINGGTLNYSGLVYDSDILIVCLDKTNPIAFNSIVELDDCLYIYQIAVQNKYKNQGIGTNLMQKAISIAETKEKTITAHVRDYNIASNTLFKKLGFDPIEPGSNTLYLLDTKSKKHQNKFNK